MDIKMKEFFLKLLGFKQCDECHKWFRKLKPTIIPIDKKLGLGYKFYLCNQCKMMLIGE